MRKALILVNQQHDDPKFTELPGAAVDAKHLKAVLGTGEIGGFDVNIVGPDKTARDWQKAIQAFFNNATRDDLLLLHLSCHGRKDARNRLHFVTRDTEHDMLEATAVSAEFLADRMEQSRSRSTVLLLDCCYSGAFTKGVRTRGAPLPEVDVSGAFQGKGRVVITSSTSLQYSYESEARSRQPQLPSVFTSAIVDGLSSGDADLNNDGLITVDELFQFVSDRVTEKFPEQTPTLSVVSASGEIVLAGNPKACPLPRNPPEPQDPLAPAAAKLALRVRGTLPRLAEEQRLPLRWHLAPHGLTAPWFAIRDAFANRDSDDKESAEPPSLTGELNDIVAAYRSVPSGRLLVLGQAGSGKTTLIQQFALALLTGPPAERPATDPVPVIFAIGAWNPVTTTLEGWLTDHLLRDYPALEAFGPNGSTSAAELVQDRRILPLLDGFDEIAEGLRVEALNALNGASEREWKFVLTSRAEEYKKAVDSERSEGVLSSAAGIELIDLSLESASTYLKSGHRNSAWEPVLTALQQPQNAPGAALAEVLKTPLMVSLARKVYRASRGRKPSELLQKFDTPAAVEDHLLDSFVATAYPNQAENRSRWAPERVHRTLGYLANHLERAGTPDLEWWAFGTSLRLLPRTLVVGLVCGLVFGLMQTLMIFAVPMNGRAGETTFALALTGERTVVIGATFGLLHAIAVRFWPATLKPLRELPQIRARQERTSDRSPEKFVSGFRDGFPIGAVAGLVGILGLVAGDGLLAGLWVGQPGGILKLLVQEFLPGLIGVLGVALVVGLVAGLMAWCSTPVDTDAADGTATLLKINRTGVLLQALAFALMGALGLGAVDALVQGAVLGTLFGVMGGLTIGVCGAFSITAWGQWVVFARIWLPLTGRMPWAVAAFLDDACGRGVLRQAGAAYQFRHARLQGRMLQFWRDLSDHPARHV